jgi:hypothetical protein
MLARAAVGWPRGPKKVAVGRTTRRPTRWTTHEQIRGPIGWAGVHEGRDSSMEVTPAMVWTGRRRTSLMATGHRLGQGGGGPGRVEED